MRASIRGMVAAVYARRIAYLPPFSVLVEFLLNPPFYRARSIWVVENAVAEPSWRIMRLCAEVSHKIIVVLREFEIIDERRLCLMPRLDDDEPRGLVRYDPVAFFEAANLNPAFAFDKEGVLARNVRSLASACE